MNSTAIGVVFLIFAAIIITGIIIGIVNRRRNK